MVLGALFWIAAWRRASSQGVAIAAVGGLLLLQLALLPYLVPLEPGEGLSGQALTTLATLHPWLAVAFLLLVAGALQALATRLRWNLLGVTAAGSLLPGLALFSLGWTRGTQPAADWPDFGPLSQGLGQAYGLEALPPALLPAALLGVVVVAWAVSRLVPSRADGTDDAAGQLQRLQPSHGVAGLLLAAGVAALVASTQLPAAGSLTLLLVGLAALGWVCAAWPGPRWLPLAGLGLAAAGLLVAGVQSDEGLLGAGAVLVFLFWLAPFLASALPGGGRLVESPTPWLASALAGPLLFLPLHAGWEHSLGESAIGLLPLTLGAGTLVAATVLRDRLSRSGGHTLTVYIGVALLFACLAVPVQLRNEWLTVGWMLEGAALAWMSRRVRHPGVVLLSLALLTVATVRLVFNLEVLGYHDLAEPSLLNWTLYGYGVPVLALLAAAFWLRPLPTGEDQRSPPPWTWLRRTTPVVVLMAVAVAFVLVNLEVSAAFPEGQGLHLWSSSLEASMTRSISWAFFGLLLLLPGQRADFRYLRPVALLFLLAAALKVFLLDLWQLSGIVRVGSLFGVAITLILAALAFQRLVLRADDDEEAS